MSQQNQNLKQRLIEGLNQIPESWALTPLLGNKAPYRSNWQHESPIERSQLVAALLDGEIVTYTKEDGSTYHKRIFPQGYGIRTGVVSGGIVAVDLDGQSANPYILELSGGEELPLTVAFTSGRKGRRQYLFRVPEQYWQGIQTKKYKTGVKGDDGKPEQVELRWDGCQSVLPPSVHPTTGQYRWVEGCAPWSGEIAQAPLWLLELMLFDRSVAQQQQQPSISATEASTPHRTRISSHSQSWTDVDWALSYLNALSPSRSDDYDDWLAVGMALHSVDDSLLMEWDSWSRQSSKYKAGECDRKWKSFKRTGVSIGSLAHMAKQDGWLKPFSGRQSSGTNSVMQNRLKPHSATSTPDIGYHSSGSGSDSGSGSGSADVSNNSQSNTPYDLVKGLMSNGKTQAQLSGELIQLAAVTGYALGGLERLRHEIEAELSKEAVQAEDSYEFTKLIDYRQQDLDLHRIFPEPLAKMLLTKADSDRIDLAFPYLYLLPTVAGQLGGHIALLGKEGETNRDNWLEWPLLWTMAVAPPSSGKSQTQRTIMGPVKRVQDSTRANYKKSLKYLEQLEDLWQKLSPDERVELKDSDRNPNVYREQMPPAPRIHLIEGGSPEGAFKRMGELGASNGVVLVFDELSRLLALDQYKSNGGDTRQLLLQAWNGPLSLELHRVDDNDSIHLNQLCLSLTGGIQPARVRKLMTDPDDGDGLLSRLLIGTTKTPENFDRWSDTKVAVDEALSGLYEHLRNLHYNLRTRAGLPDEDELGQQPTVVLQFTRDAEELWHRWWEELRRGMKAAEHENPALYGYLGKMLSQTLRLALEFHAIELYYEHKANPLEVGLQTLERAIYAARWHIGQFQLLQAGTDNTSLPGDLAKIHAFAMRRGKEVSAEQVQNSVFKRTERKPTLATIRQWFAMIAQAGACVLVGAGRELKMKAIALASKVAGAVGIPTLSDNYSDNSQKPESTAFQVTQELATKNSDYSDNSFSAFATTSTDGSHVVMGVVEGIDKNSSLVCRNCRNDSEEVPSNPRPEPVLGDKALSETQSEDVGDSDNPDDDPPGGDGGSPVTPTTTPPSGDDGGELLNDEEMAAWHSRLSACQTLNDAMDFHAALDALSPSQRHQFESSVPQERWTWLWSLPEVTEQQPLAVPALSEKEPLTVQEPESKPESEPTVSELKALLMACDSLVKLNELKRKHKKTIAKAYDSMSEEEQAHVDAIAATAVPHKVFKYLGEEIQLGTERLHRGMLVYIDPQTHVRATAFSVPVWAINGVGSGWKKPIHVSLGLLKEVVKVMKPENHAL